MQCIATVFFRLTNLWLYFIISRMICFHIVQSFNMAHRMFTNRNKDLWFCCNKKAKVDKSVYCCCRDTVSQTWWFKPQIHTLSQFWRLEVWDQGVDRVVLVCVFSEICLLGLDMTTLSSFPVSLHGFPSGHVCVLIFFSCECTSLSTWICFTLLPS